jgi:hypothetical protein
MNRRGLFLFLVVLALMVFLTVGLGWWRLRSEPGCAWRPPAPRGWPMADYDLTHSHCYPYPSHIPLAERQGYS